MAEGNSGDPRVVEVPETEARLEAFKGALLLALSRLPGATRSKLADEVEQQAHQLRSMRDGDPDHLASHLVPGAWFITCQFQVTPVIDRALILKELLVLGVTLI